MLFSHVRPRSVAGLAAEVAYNCSVTWHGQNNIDALRDLVAAHIANYPAGIDPHHIRRDHFGLPMNGHQPQTTTARPGEGASR